MKRIIFRTKMIKFGGVLNDSQAASEIYNNLPVESDLSVWGKEIYFNLGFKVASDSATMDLAAGDIGYWPQGKSLCIFFGPTPLSEEEDKPVPASPVVVVGKIDSKVSGLDKVELGDKIVVEKD
ncbi:MAG: hypothetical protein K9M14_05845 [Candidatus Omnitrophica bacterium]|nr:hypothetical protein [Candidatus Omnitrophota bacterium]MCF7877826.1 hypothetical protein [Candidatus Omnitrophota bacterium]MCF7892227.1 hypothetical protein [Candidatus Omnitrophota bacterium]MCF7895973.1 hypothetical protein [Candidatus Omnitrophota bacterium]MCF7909982.1 hypothetical protein [Candidatus Omnitrophota bacterium]